MELCKFKEKTGNREKIHWNILSSLACNEGRVCVLITYLIDFILLIQDILIVMIDI